jgi:hypothetical protein
VSDRIDDGEAYDPRDIIDAIERLAVHEPDVAQRLMDASRLYRLRGATMGNARCDRLADMAAAAGCAEDYAARREQCEDVITRAQEFGPEAAEQRAEAAEAALAAMPRPEDRCHGEWPCEASTYAASLEAELQQAQADARLILAAFVGANAEGVIEYRMTNADRDAIDVLIESVFDTLEDSLLVATIRRVASIPDNPQETSETAGSITE